MEVSQALKEVMKESDISNAELARRCDQTPQATHARIKNGNPTIKGLSDLLKVMGWQVVIMPAGKRLPEGAIVVTGAKKEE